jgi:hypothetical protein
LIHFVDVEQALNDAALRDRRENVDPALSEF